MPKTALDLSIDSDAELTTRIRKTRVLIVSDHPTESLAVAKSLRALDLDVQLSLFDGTILSSMPTAQPDAVLCHLTDFVDQGPKLAKVVRAHFSSRSIPLIGAMSRPSSINSSDFDSTIYAPMHPSQIANRVNAMIRLGVMEGEIERRLETLRKDFDQNLTVKDFTSERKFRVLFIGKASPSFMVVINALQDKGVEVIAAFTSFSAFDYLHGDPFDAVVMNALEHSEPAFSISEAIKRNSKLYHIPTLFLVDGQTFSDHDAAYQRGALDIIDKNSDTAEISGRILELANYHRIHEQMKSDFQELFIKLAGDLSGTAYSQKFMRGHLPRMLRDANRSSQPTTLIGLQLRPNSSGSVTDGALNSAYSQTAELLKNLVRMQDVVCRWSENIFLLAFYNTNLTEAKAILSRIKALLDYSVYGTGYDDHDALSMSADSSILEINRQNNSTHNHLEILIGNLKENPESF